MPSKPRCLVWHRAYNRVAGNPHAIVRIIKRPVFKGYQWYISGLPQGFDRGGKTATQVAATISASNAINELVESGYLGSPIDQWQCLKWEKEERLFGNQRKVWS